MAPEEIPEFGPPIGPDEAELPDESPDLDELDPFEVNPEEYDDISEFVSDEWRASATARERVRDTIYRTTSPMTAPEIAELAEVSPPTARTKLSNLADEGVVLAESSTNGTVYQRDPDWYRLKRVHRLADKPQSTIESVLRRIEKEIQGYREEYGIDTPEDLILEDEDLGDEAWQDVSEWRTAIVDKHYMRAALQFRRLRAVEPSNFDLSSSDSDRTDQSVVDP